MDKREYYWERFYRTGDIDAYMAYKDCLMYDPANDADIKRRLAESRLGGPWGTHSRTKA